VNASVDTVPLEDDSPFQESFLTSGKTDNFRQCHRGTSQGGTLPGMKSVDQQQLLTDE
jgi:hypothetical protein